MKLITTLAGILSLLLIVLAGPLYKAEILGLMNAFFTMRIALIVGAVTIVLALIQIIFMRKNISWPATGLAVLFAAVAISMPLSMMMKAKSVPAIHDITTDLSNPPQFVEILALRKNALNPAGYAGEKIASQQREAYPELQTQTYSHTPELVFDAALVSVKSMGLEIVSSDQDKGIIEAFHKSLWFGFVDDMVIRINSREQLTILDIRSKSRVGISDLGKNAERITNVLAGINKTLN